MLQNILLEHKDKDSETGVAELMKQSTELVNTIAVGDDDDAMKQDKHRRIVSDIHQSSELLHRDEDSKMINGEQKTKYNRLQLLSAANSKTMFSSNLLSEKNEQKEEVSRGTSSVPSEPIINIYATGTMLETAPRDSSSQEQQQQ